MSKTQFMFKITNWIVNGKCWEFYIINIYINGSKCKCKGN